MMALKKCFLSLLLLSLFFSQSALSMEQGRDDSSGFVDDSLKDISIVLGTCAAGAVLGLSTLSFVNEPSEHLKNIAVGGAIGIVVGVGIVVFSQATRTSSVIGAQMEIPVSPDKFETITRHEFSDYKIAENYLNKPNVLGYSFSF
jgi:hypothetical protein